MERTYLQPANVPKPAGDYSQGVMVKGGTLVVISGQVPWDADAKLVGPNDLVAQTHQVFKNLQNMLAAAGATFKDAIKLTIFLKNREDFLVFKDIRAQYLTPPYPPHHPAGGEGPRPGGVDARGRDNGDDRQVAPTGARQQSRGAAPLEGVSAPASSSETCSRSAG